MQTAGVAELKAKLSSYLERVKAGEEVIVTERGRAIARVVPLARGGPTPAEYEEMARAGIIRPPERRGLPPDFWDNVPEDPDGLVLKALLAEREENR
jgi:prevent-host-death family protein